jgi:hypothetical protein
LPAVPTGFAVVNLTLALGICHTNVFMHDSSFLAKGKKAPGCSQQTPEIQIPD